MQRSVSNSDEPSLPVMALVSAVSKLISFNLHNINTLDIPGRGRAEIDHKEARKMEASLKNCIASKFVENSKNTRGLMRELSRRLRSFAVAPLKP
ncbi:hypothetical protein ACHAO8_010205 [Botrytis cinerea]